MSWGAAGNMMAEWVKYSHQQRRQWCFFYCLTETVLSAHSLTLYPSGKSSNFTRPVKQPLPHYITNSPLSLMPSQFYLTLDGSLSTFYLRVRLTGRYLELLLDGSRQ